ncbi:hypothetical protein LTR53_011689 [Teratosphaeriaceae sp. CCFEE 6253]|nr:hypothetical protein LTR53_011689 [Teratosphaeriaceae sp. CCFEE 6253]
MAAQRTPLAAVAVAESWVAGGVKAELGVGAGVGVGIGVGVGVGTLLRQGRWIARPTLARVEASALALPPRRERMHLGSGWGKRGDAGLNINFGLTSLPDLTTTPCSAVFNMTSRNNEAALRNGGSPEPSQDSQGIDTGSIQEMLERHKQNVRPGSTPESRHRRPATDVRTSSRSRQEAIEAAHTLRLAELSGGLERATTKHNETVSRPKLELLIQLIDKKQSLQRTIEACHSQKDAAYIGTAHKIQLAINARIATMK